MLQAIGELPEEEREALDLVRVQGMTPMEAAQVLGVSAVTVKRRLTRGLRLLAEHLADLRPCAEVAGVQAEGAGDGQGLERPRV
jgi:RNA polymerase sigma-70 factor (ECF subfamily)